jgi:hypothetical protein
MAGHRDGDVIFGEVVNRVTAGPDFDLPAFLAPSAAGPVDCATHRYGTNTAR